MPEVTARTPIGAAIQAARAATKEEPSRQSTSSVVSEPQAEVTKATPEDPRLVAMARREKVLRQQQREFQLQKEQWETSRPQTPQVDPEVARQKMIEDYRARIADDPMAVVSELGLEVNKLRDSYSSAQKLLDEQAKERAEAAKGQIRASVKSVIDGDPKFEVTKSMNAYDAVVELVQLSVSEGEEMSIEEAAEKVEDYLMEEALKAAAIPKVKLKLTPEQKAELTEAAQTEINKQTTTLSRSESPSKPVSTKDRRQRAIWAGQGLDPNTGKPF